MLGLFNKFIQDREKAKQDASTLCNEYMEKILAATKEFDAIFIDKGKFIDNQTIYIWFHKWSDFISIVNNLNHRTIKKSPIGRKTSEEIYSFLEMVGDSESKRSRHNNRVVSSHLAGAKKIICPIEGRMLDDQQLTCILKDVNNHLVVAGAGTGKTTTVVGKIKYLLKTDQFKAEDILVLSFTNASASEMRERIIKETEQQIDAMTFHKLGMNIITCTDNMKPNITQINLSSYVKDSLKKHMNDPAYLRKLITYLLYNNSKSKSEFEFKSQAEYDDYLKANPPITLNNETVKSYAEMDIANFLYKNRINYIYEHPYKINTASVEFGRYLPDFYLPDYDIYIEHFALDRNGSVPNYFTSRGNMSASESYKSSIDWKRKTHSENSTRMIELYYYDKQEGQLLQRLENKLKLENVEFNAMSDTELWQEIASSENNIFEGISKLFETVINLIKSNDYSFEQVYSLNNNSRVSDRSNNLIVLQLTEPIFNDYCNELKMNSEIDFNDMINIASKHVYEGKFIHNYKYVIVDEYQDISKSRYNLLKRMRDQKFYKLFCVGDDWQSIYRFAGSDISFIFDFDKYWGLSEKSKIETTYRFSSSLIDISGQFVMRNPKQIRKSLHSLSNESVFSLGLIEGYTQNNAVDFMVDKIKELPKNSKVYFIGRYAFDVEMLNNSAFTYQYNNALRKTSVVLPIRNDLEIEFLTAHKSKGLQADYVFILNNKKRWMGFPSSMQDDDVLQLLLEGSDTYEFAEERRLFYVAMTRARKKVWLLVEKENKSDFVEELMSSFEKEIKNERFTCPKCGGRLIKKNGKFGEFFGCSNYKDGCKYTRNYGKRG